MARPDPTAPSVKFEPLEDWGRQPRSTKMRNTMRGRKRKRRQGERSHMVRFIRRTWRQTSEKICLANDFPPGFRIVLLDEDGRLKRDDLSVRSGDFMAYPQYFMVSAFLEQVIMNNVKDADCLDYTNMQLRDHRNEPRRSRAHTAHHARHAGCWRQV